MCLPSKLRAQRVNRMEKAIEVFEESLNSSNIVKTLFLGHANQADLVQSQFHSMKLDTSKILALVYSIE